MNRILTRLKLKFYFTKIEKVTKYCTKQRLEMYTKQQDVKYEWRLIRSYTVLTGNSTSMLLLYRILDGFRTATARINNSVRCSYTLTLPMNVFNSAERKTCNTTVQYICTMPQDIILNMPIKYTTRGGGGG